MRSLINFAMHKIKPVALRAVRVQIDFKATIEMFLATDDSVKGTLAYWKQILYDVLAMVKQLEILTLSCADLRWEEHPNIITKLNNLGLSDAELKSLSYQERRNLLKISQYL